MPGVHRPAVRSSAAFPPEPPEQPLALSTMPLDPVLLDWLLGADPGLRWQLLERRLLRTLSTGELVAPWPTWFA